MRFIGVTVALVGGAAIVALLAPALLVGAAVVDLVRVVRR